MDRSILQRVIRADTEAVPGYVVEEIVRMSMIDDACFDIQDFLMKSLDQHYKQHDPFVKCKLLRVIKHVCETGNPQFRLSLQRKASVLKSFLSYRSAPDPLRGDAPSRDVREEAERCIKALYGIEALPVEHRTTQKSSQFYRYNESLDQPDQSQSTSRIRGFGNDPINGAATMTRRLGKLEGFGNPHFAYQNESEQNNSVAGSMSEVVSVQADNIVQGLSQAAYTVSRYLPESLKAQIDAFGHKLALPGKTILTTSQRSDFESSRFRGFAGGSQSYSSSAAYSPPQDRAPSSLFSSFERGATPERMAGGFRRAEPPFAPDAVLSPTDVPITDALQPLITLVEGLCSSTTSLKPSPPRSALAEFFKKVSLDSQSSNIIQILLSKLTSYGDSLVPSLRPSTTWQAKYRVICCLDALVGPTNPFESRSLFQRTLKELGHDILIATQKSSPRCRQVIDDLLQKLSSERETSSSSVADYLAEFPKSSADDVSREPDFTSDEEQRVTTVDLLGVEHQQAPAPTHSNDLLDDLLGTYNTPLTTSLSNNPSLLEEVNFPANSTIAHEEFSGLFSGLVVNPQGNSYPPTSQDSGKMEKWELQMAPSSETAKKYPFPIFPAEGVAGSVTSPALPVSFPQTAASPQHYNAPSENFFHFVR